MRRLPLLASLLLLPAAAPSPTPGHNVLFFVADGLRDGMVTPANAPALAAFLEGGVHFVSPHSLFPTFTTANASAFATGHQLGDTGDFSNVLYAGFPVADADDSPVPFLESDPVLADMNQHFAGNYLDETTVLRAASDAGIATAVIGKLGPALIQDSTAGRRTLVIDDQTGRPGGVPLDADLAKRMTAAGLPTTAPTRGDNAKFGTDTVPGTTIANVAQQTWFTDVATRAVLPMLSSRGRFALTFWSRDPDGTQHNEGDSLGKLTPGINGPTSLAAIRNADNCFAALLAALKAQHLDATTDVFVASDHGFSTIAKESHTSFAASQHYPGVRAADLPPGFVAIDLAHALKLKRFDPDAHGAAVTDGQLTKRGSALLGDDAAHPRVIVALNGGSDLIYLPGGDAALAGRIVDALSAEDYTSGLFVDDRLGRIDGTLPFSFIGLKGGALTPVPAIAVSFRSFPTCDGDPTTCTAEIADTMFQAGQGMHGSFSRADTRNLLGAGGPDFRGGFNDRAPASTADLGRTMAHVLGLDVKPHGALVGRVLSEAFIDGPPPPPGFGGEQRSLRDAHGHQTAIHLREVLSERYYDAAGYPDRTVGLAP